MKRILVPTDFSSFASKAVAYAIGLAKKSGGQILLLHVCNQLDPKYSRHTNLIKEFNDQQVKNLINKLVSIQDELVQQGINVEILLYNGEITESILWVAQNKDVDLIVMGTQGATGLKTAIFGTKTAAVIRESTIPVFTIPFNYEWKEPKQVLLAVNTYTEKSQVYSTLIEFAKLFNTTIGIFVFSNLKAEAVDVLDHSRTIDKIQSNLTQQFENRQIEAAHVSGNDFYQSLQEYIETNQIDLLVMVTHKRNFIQSIFNASMTRQMAYHTTVPLLALHTNDI